MNRKICVITGSRAEYGLFYPILVKIKESTRLDLQLITTSSHHSSEHGNTYKLIEDDGFFIDEKINNLNFSDSKSSIVKSAAKASSILSDSFEHALVDDIFDLSTRIIFHPFNDCLNAFGVERMLFLLQINFKYFHSFI